MLTQNGFSNCKSKIMEQALKLFWCGAWFAIPVSIGCEWNSQTGMDRKIQTNETTTTSTSTTSSPEIAGSAEETYSQRNESNRTVDLEIVVTGFSQNSGSCRIAVYLGQPHFNDPEYAIAKESIAIRDSKATWQVKVVIPQESSRDLESSTRLAVSAYHDENDNSRLDKSSFGVPTERYGFSTNPKRGFGPPQFGETAMELSWTKLPSDSNLTLEIPIQIK